MNNYTDEQIIKALEWLILNFPKQIPAKDDTDRLCNCINLYCQNALDLINRQKAEIERLHTIINCYEETSGNKKARAEATTEFAERLKEKIKVCEIDEPFDIIDQIAKELKGEQ